MKTVIWPERAVRPRDEDEHWVALVAAVILRARIDARYSLEAQRFVAYVEQAATQAQRRRAA